MEESPAFVEFLEFLGHRIELHDFKGFGRCSPFLLFSVHFLAKQSILDPSHTLSWTLGYWSDPFEKENKRKTLGSPHICGGTVRVIDRADKTPLSVHKRWMKVDGEAALGILPLLMLPFCLPHTGWSQFPLLAAHFCSLCSSSSGPQSLLYFLSPSGFGEAWMSLMGRRGQNLFTQVSIIRRLCSTCPPSCLTQKETRSRYRVIT